MRGPLRPRAARGQKPSRTKRTVRSRLGVFPCQDFSSFMPQMQQLKAQIIGLATAGASVDSVQRKGTGRRCALR